MRSNKTKELVMTALMAALVFIATYLIRIPNPATGGYHHLGDCMIFLAVVLLGRRQGALAAGIGAALSDFLAGAAMWILPTFIIKYVMAFIMATIIKGNPWAKKRQITGASIGGLFQVIAYTLCSALFYSPQAAIITIPNEILQSAVGIAAFLVLSAAIPKSLRK